MFTLGPIHEPRLSAIMFEIPCLGLRFELKREARNENSREARGPRPEEEQKESGHVEEIFSRLLPGIKKSANCEIPRQRSFFRYYAGTGAAP